MPQRTHALPQRMLCAALLLAFSTSAAARQRRALRDAGAPAGADTGDPFIRTPLSEAIEAAGSLEATAEGAVAPPRPLVIDFVQVPTRGSVPRPPADVDYLMNQMLPAAAGVLKRSVRVRRRSGVLRFDNAQDDYETPVDLPIPDPSRGYNGDLVVLIEAQAVPTGGCESDAAAASIVYEAGTGRPVLGEAEFCAIDPKDFEYGISLAVHEILHIMAFNSDDFDLFAGYPGGFPTTTRKNGNIVIRAPQSQAFAREFFECPTMPGPEFGLDDPEQGADSGSGHWATRTFNGEIMDPVSPETDTHFNVHVMTDLTLSFLQDTNWYDVKYGSAGFLSYGYRGGCAFATGTQGAVRADPRAARYLCTVGATDDYGDPAAVCLHDYSGPGECDTDYGGEFLALNSILLEDIEAAGPKKAIDCHALAPGSRCVLERTSAGEDESGDGSSGGATFPTCIAMSCSQAGEVLVGGRPCDPERFVCPDAGLMCDDPGYVSCGALNDCSGQGDCFRGRCFCHSGFGGDDCSVPVCIDKCPNGSLCPSSGFCGVPACGTWSSGSLDRGTPCNRGAALEPLAVGGSRPVTPMSDAPGSAADSDGDSGAAEPEASPAAADYDAEPEDGPAIEDGGGTPPRGPADEDYDYAPDIAPATSNAGASQGSGSAQGDYDVAQEPARAAEDYVYEPEAEPDSDSADSGTDAGPRNSPADEDYSAEDDPEPAPAAGDADYDYDADAQAGPAVPAGPAAEDYDYENR